MFAISEREGDMGPSGSQMTPNCVHKLKQLDAGPKRFWYSEENVLFGTDRWQHPGPSSQPDHVLTIIHDSEPPARAPLRSPQPFRMSVRRS